jgi:hypothetical protein
MSPDEGKRNHGFLFLFRDLPAARHDASYDKTILMWIAGAHCAKMEDENHI